MAIDPSSENRNEYLSRGISIAIILCAAVTGIMVLRQVAADPRTDDAEVFANYIGIAPLVSGPITQAPCC
jgi:multidrug efflux system membrane fusion protein